MWGLKQEDLVKKEKLSKLAILDTLLAKKEPLSEAEETAKNKILADEEMGVDYSYSQPSQDDSYGHDSGDSGCSEIEAAIQMDQAEIDAARRQYPPQPEVEFGFPKECYCGGEPLVATSYTTNDPGRRYTNNVGAHVFLNL
ncbi:Uncharacterized protein Rs2_41476 [Raphanus sativus]|nr:Uncharacterized protein Rs2_41476 [Raphanus sativus]